MSDRPLWNEKAQTTPETQLAGLARAGLAREWERVWSEPIEFYRDRYRDRGYSPDEMPPLEDIPRTTKADLRANEAARPPFGTHRPFGIRDAVRIGGSTGTSGVPVFIMFGPRDLEIAIEFQARVLWRYGVRPGDSFTHSWPQGFYVSSTTTALWFTRVGILEIPVGPPISLDAAGEHLRLWDRLRPDGFQMTSSQLWTYQEAAKREGFDLTELFEGKAIGLLDAVYQFEGPRRRIEDQYGFRMRNLGGVGDIPGFGLTDCEFHTGLHVPGDYVAVEIVDPTTGLPVPAGERGNLVLSVFGMDSFFLRYDVEDICTLAADPCPCGETGPRLTLYGRAMDGVRAGRRTILPIDIQLALEEHGAPEFQLAAPDAQDGTSVRVRVEGDGTAARLAGALTAAIDVPVEVETIAVGTLPRAAFKPRRIES